MIPSQNFRPQKQVVPAEVVVSAAMAVVPAVPVAVGVASRSGISGFTHCCTESMAAVMRLLLAMAVDSSAKVE